MHIIFSVFQNTLSLFHPVHTKITKLLDLFFLFTKADGWLVIDNTADIDFLSCCEMNGIYVKISVTQFQVTANSLASLEIVIFLVVLQPAHFSAAVSSKLRNQEKKKCCFSKIDTRKSN